MTPKQRSRCMAAIKGKDPKPEMIVRKYLFSRGWRCRVNNRKLPGSPDIVLKKYKTVAFGMVMRVASIIGFLKPRLTSVVTR